MYVTVYSYSLFIPNLQHRYKFFPNIGAGNGILWVRPKNFAGNVDTLSSDKAIRRDNSNGVYMGLSWFTVL